MHAVTYSFHTFGLQILYKLLSTNVNELQCKEQHFSINAIWNKS